MTSTTLETGRGFVPIGVAMDADGWEKAKLYLEQHPINYPIVVGDGDFPKIYGVTQPIR
jgi:hypothetical protein